MILIDRAQAERARATDSEYLRGSRFEVISQIDAYRDFPFLLTLSTVYRTLVPFDAIQKT